jgi:centromeric protein E
LRSPSLSLDTGAGEASGNNDDEGDGEGIASLQAQNKALQSDLADKNRYISTLEKRLLQARRSSHGRNSTGITLATLQEKDAEIADLRHQLDERNRTVMALRSAASASTISAADSNVTTPVSPGGRNHHASDSYGSSSAATSDSTFSPVDLTAKSKSPFGGVLPVSRNQSHDHVQAEGQQQQKGEAKAAEVDRSASVRSSNNNNVRNSNTSTAQQQRRSIEEMSRMLDEMIQEKVERGELVSDRPISLERNGGNGNGDRRISSSGSLRAVRQRRQESWQAEGLPSVAALAKGLRTDSTHISGVGLGLDVEGI